MASMTTRSVIWFAIRRIHAGRKIAKDVILTRRCTTKAISRFPVPETKDWPVDLQDRVRPIEEKSGFLPNVFRALAHRPDEFRAFFDYHDAIMLREGGLTKAEKELIIVATSAENQCTLLRCCTWCITRIFSKNPQLADQVATNWREADLTEREKAILDLAEQFATPEAVDEEDFEDVYRFGLDKDDVWDIGVIVAFFAMSNRLAFLSKMRPNNEFYLLGRFK